MRPGRDQGRQTIRLTSMSPPPGVALPATLQHMAASSSCRENLSWLVRALSSTTRAPYKSRMTIQAQDLYLFDPADDSSW